MSIRSLIEINHDLAGDLGDEFLLSLATYLASGSREAAHDLEPFGVRVIGQRHHSGRFAVAGQPDGFPVIHITASIGGAR